MDLTRVVVYFYQHPTIILTMGDGTQPMSRLALRSLHQPALETTPAANAPPVPTRPRVQVIQYINAVEADSIPGPVPSTTSGGKIIVWLPSDGFQGDDVEKHGTHTAGSAVGATLNNPAKTPTTCSGTEVPGCVGGCIDADRSSWGDDLLTLLPDHSHFDVDFDRLCPMVDCDDATDQRCLNDDVGQTLADHGGMAQGAKLAFFDVFAGDASLRQLVGDGLWEPCLEAGCKIHSVSIGADRECTVHDLDVLYDDFMYNVSCRPKLHLTPYLFLSYLTWYTSARRWIDHRILETSTWFDYFEILGSCGSTTFKIIDLKCIH